MGHFQTRGVAAGAGGRLAIRTIAATRSREDAGSGCPPGHLAARTKGVVVIWLVIVIAAIIAAVTWWRIRRRETRTTDPSRHPFNPDDVRGRVEYDAMGDHLRDKHRKQY